MEYGQNYPDSPIELVNARVTGIGKMPKISNNNIINSAERNFKNALVKTDKCTFRVSGVLKAYDTNYLIRDFLPISEIFEGPAIIFQKDTTTVVPPNCSFTQEKSGNLFISIGTKNE